MKDTMDLEPGMVLAQDILNNYDAIVLSAGTKLTPEHIMNLTVMDLGFVFVEDAPEDESDFESTIGEMPVLMFEEEITHPKPMERPAELIHSESSRRARFDEAVLYYKKIYGDVQVGKSVDSKEVLDIIKGLVKEFYKYDDIFTLLKKMKSDEAYEYTHSTSVSILSVLLGKWLRIPQQSIYKLAQAAFLADLGKALVPKEILKKRDKLTTDERSRVEEHVVLTKQILWNSGGFDMDVIHIIETHHERLNGSGYPNRMDSGCINQLTRIVSVADTYHALLSERPYREAYSIVEATELLWDMSYSELDPCVTERLVKFITSFLVGGEVILSNGKKGEIIMANQYDKFRPLVRVNDEFIDLSQNRTCKIVGIVGSM
jgi:HD-GYP domain-containing protein (c-di-GMP phosphodiesterase class II)